MNETSVSVRKLTKSFSGRRVVDDLSFDVQRGEVFALLGHNGAGKSTTIDLILGLKSPDSGTARILGMDAARQRRQVFARVGVQLQNTRYQPGITVEEACIYHRGSYSSLSQSYETLLRYIEENGYEIDGEIRESYIDGVWNREDVRQWLSEIQIPVRKRRDAPA